MDPIARNLVKIQIEDEMRSSYLDYSMSVIIGRALPDVRDGLTPVHRRILYAMFREGLLSNRRYSKCAGVVGEVLKKYHPHGDAAVYDALVRMAQPWNMRYLLVDGQGNFGSVDGDNAAAYRYTESRMTRLAEELLADIDKETVDFQPNYDGAHTEPEVLPAAFPNLLVNGAEGIAVGMATKIPPHNLGEVVDACVAMIDNPDIDVLGLMQHIQGPDFPTAGIICGRAGIRDAYETGRGSLTIRGKVEFEEVDGREAIIITELPFQVNKARLQEYIAELVKDKKLEGIHGLRDESDRSGMRVVVELKRDAIREIVLNALYKHTALQSTFGVILLAIVAQRPRVLNLREMIYYYLAHRREVTVRRTRFELRKAKERAHILEGLRIALDHIDAVIALIRASRTTELARQGLVSQFGLSEPQAQAILEMRLSRLTGLERDKIEEEYAELCRQIEWLTSVLADEGTLWGVIRAELVAIRERHADPRRTRIEDSASDIHRLDLVAEEDQVLTMSNLQYIKRTPMGEYRTQRRGGVGKTAMNARDGDFVKDVFVGNTHGKLLLFTNTGRMYLLPVIEVPEAAPAARGKPIQNLVTLAEGEVVTSVVPIGGLDDEGDLVFATRRGLAKRTALSAYANVRANGIIALDIVEGDELLSVEHAGPDAELLFSTRGGRAIRFKMDDPGRGLRPLGRVSRGVRAVRVDEGDAVVGFSVITASAGRFVFTMTERGYAKRTWLDAADAIDDGTDPVEPDDEAADEADDDGDEAAGDTPAENGAKGYRLQSRGGKGILDMKTKNGPIVGTLIVSEADQVFVVTDSGRVIRSRIADVRATARNTQGVRFMRLDDDERIVAITRVPEEGDEEGTEPPPEAEAGGEG
jgi:DNA gyrase subunit A